MATERRQQLLLAAALIVLVAVSYWAWRQTSPAPGPSSNGKTATAATTGSRQDAARVDAPAVHLDALERERPKQGGTERDLFRFKPKAAPPPPPSAIGRGGTPGTTAPPPVASGPPPVPPITLKFIGVIDQGAGKPKIAILTDGIGPPIHGVEGGTVAGKYKILRIGAESIEMAYLDGRGRQTIRLSGS